MTWRETYRQPSFRGVPFEVPDDSLSGGRRYATHVYPGRDTALNEDLGLSPNDYSIEALIVGDDFAQRRDRLVRALRQPGPGKLVHPWFGEVQVIAVSWSIRHSSREGRACRLRITFKDKGANVRPIESSDSRLAIAETATSAEAAIGDDFITWFDAGTPGDFVEDAAVETLGGRITGLVEEVSLYADSGGAVLEDALSIAENARDLVRNPLSLVDRVFPVFDKITGLAELSDLASLTGLANLSDLTSLTGLTSLAGGLQGSLLRALRFFGSSGDSLDPVPLTTARRRRQAANQTALVSLFKRTAAVTEARLVPDISFETRDDAIATRDSVVANLDRLILDAEPSFDAAPLRRLQADVVADINPRALDLSRLSSFTPARTLPLDVIAYRLYGATDQADFITARNRVRHPGFATGGRALEVRVLEGGADG